MIHTHFINCKMLTIFWFILWLKWKADTPEELDIHRQSLDTTNPGPLGRKTLLSEDGQSWRCGKMFVSAKSQCPSKSDWSVTRWAWALQVVHNYFCFREQRNSPRGKWWCNRQSNLWVLETRRASWYPAWLCVHYQPRAFTVIIVSDPVTSSWIRVRLSRKSLSQFKDYNDRDNCYPSSRLQGDFPSC